MKSNRSLIWRVGILFAFVAIVVCLSISRPEYLSSNNFMKQLMGPDLVAVLVVVLTVTFASVANIHLSISRMVSNSKNPKESANAASTVRGQINSNAWVIFWAFLAALIALFIYGQYNDNETVKSLAVSTCLTVILLNGLVMHDIYRTIFVLVSTEISSHKNPRDQDYNKTNTSI